MKKLISAMVIAVLCSLVSGDTFAAFTTSSKNYAMSGRGNVRTFFLSDSATTNGNSASVYITNPASIYVEMFGGQAGFGSGTMTLTYATDNTTFTTLPTAAVACTADCVKFVASADERSGYYRIERTGSAAAYNVVVNLIANGSVDPQ
jgi:hypothetical protein